MDMIQSLVPSVPPSLSMTTGQLTPAGRVWQLHHPCLGSVPAACVPECQTQYPRFPLQAPEGDLRAAEPAEAGD